MFSVAPVAPRLWWHDIYMEHYKEQLTTCAVSSTVEPSDITYLSNSTVSLIKITIALISATNGTVGAV